MFLSCRDELWTHYVAGDSVSTQDRSPFDFDTLVGGPVSWSQVFDFVMDSRYSHKS